MSTSGLTFPNVVEVKVGTGSAEELRGRSVRRQKLRRRTLSQTILEADMSLRRSSTAKVFILLLATAADDKAGNAACATAESEQG